MKTLIQNGTLVNEGVRGAAHIVCADGLIADILPGGQPPQGDFDEVVDATGCLVLPGVIDTHVHFREPGLTAKADMASESRAAACGGVTAYIDMPNTQPQTTTLPALADKLRRAHEDSVVDYAFFVGAAHGNAAVLRQIAAHSGTPRAIKLFMGASTGGMLVDGAQDLHEVFQTAHDCGLLVMAHCEDSAIINDNMRRARLAADDPCIAQHPLIRSREACLASTRRAIALAREHNTRLHVAHISTAEELALFRPGDPLITAEATVAHLLFCDNDYATLGARIKCNPAVKTTADRDALRHALLTGQITTIGTDHAPHLWQEKQGGCRTAASGMPMVQFSVPAMLTLAEECGLTVERVVELMCHAPALLFGMAGRGFVHKGFRANLTVVRRQPWTITPACIRSKCGWSPLEGRTLQWQVAATVVGGRTLYQHHPDGTETLCDTLRGEPITFQQTGRTIHGQ